MLKRMTQCLKYAKDIFSRSSACSFAISLKPNQKKKIPNTASQVKETQNCSHTPSAFFVLVSDLFFQSTWSCPMFVNSNGIERRKKYNPETSSSTLMRKNVFSLAPGWPWRMHLSSRKPNRLRLEGVACIHMHNLSSASWENRGVAHLSHLLVSSVAANLMTIRLTFPWRWCDFWAHQRRERLWRPCGRHSTFADNATPHKHDSWGSELLLW